MFNRLKKRGLIISVAAVAVVGFGWIGFSTYQYIQHDPSFCTSCHIMDEAYGRWSESVHSVIDCHACHTPNLKANLRQLYMYWTNPPEKPRHAPELENSVCYKCHHTGDPEHPEATLAGEQWREVLAEAGHQEHVKVQRIQCIRCHSTSLHKFVPPTEICKECHTRLNLGDSRMSDHHCLSCHSFKATGRESLRPIREDCLKCHKAMHVGTESFPESGAPMHWDCRQCHKPHDKQFLDVEDCKGCHASQIENSPIHAVATHTTCTQCHKPHTWKIDPKTSCMECHAGREEHAFGNACNMCHK